MFSKTMQYLLHIGKTQKDISNMYNLESAMIKEILGLLSKKLQEADSTGSTSKKEATPKAA